MALELIIAHMSGSIGKEKAGAVVAEAVRELGLRPQGELPPDAAEALFARLIAQDGLVGLAARVAKQMVRLRMAPLKRDP